MAIPREDYQENVLQILPLDRTVDFISLCGNDQFYLDPEVEGTSDLIITTLTSEAIAIENVLL